MECWGDGVRGAGFELREAERLLPIADMSTVHPSPSGFLLAPPTLPEDRAAAAIAAAAFIEVPPPAPPLPPPPPLLQPPPLPK